MIAGAAATDLVLTTIIMLGIILTALAISLPMAWYYNEKHKRNPRA